MRTRFAITLTIEVHSAFVRFLRSSDHTGVAFIPFMAKMSRDRGVSGMVRHGMVAVGAVNGEKGCLEWIRCLFVGRFSRVVLFLSLSR